MGRYQPLIDWLAGRSDDTLTLTLGEVGQVLGSALPASAAKYPPFWSTGNHLGRLLGEAGWSASLRAGEGTVVLRRSARPRQRVGPGRDAGTTHKPADSRPLPDLVLVGCVKEKLPGRHCAKELYTSPLFAWRRRRAEAVGCPWFVLSAKHGLVGPDEEVDSYDFKLATQGASTRRRWSEDVLKAIQQRFGEVRGKRVEIHAGAAYRDSGLVQGLRSAGAQVAVPLEGIALGEQLAHYASAEHGAAVQRAADGPESEPRQPAVRAGLGSDEIVAGLTEAFLSGTLDLSKRPGAPSPGWNALPECEAAAELRARGAKDTGVRTFLTLVAALDRAREANQLWQAATQLFCRSPWVFNPPAVVGRSLGALRDELFSFDVSRRHGPDAAAWRLICEALVSPEAPAAIPTAIREGRGDAAQLAEALQATTRAGQAWFPFISGPKVSAMWIRMLAYPGDADISNLQTVPVAVDVQVRKVSEYLGISKTQGQSLETARGVIQAAWKEHAPRAAGPPALQGTAAAIDPAVWFFGKWGCTHCERTGKATPISPVCDACSLRRKPATS